MDQDAKAAASAKAVRIVLVASIVVGAAMIAVVGAFMPGLLELTGPEATWIPLVFYAVAIADLVIAYFIWNRLKKARRSSARDGGAVQRQ